MYFDTSSNKFVTLGLVGFVLAIAIVLTFQAKNFFFGSTPFFPATSIFVSSIFDSAAYTLSSTGRQMAGVFSAFTGEEEEPVRDARAIPVLTYHRITQWHGSASGEESSGAGEGANVSLPTFRDQMEALKDAGWETITLEEFRAYIRGERTLPEKSFLLTFDDGAKDSFYPVDPILSSLGFSAVNYLIVTGVEREGSTYYLSNEEVERMLDTGRWEIGSHTYDSHHPIAVNAAGDLAPALANLEWKTSENRLETVAEYRARLEAEFRGSRNLLSQEFGVPITTFAFPFGDTGERSLNFPGAEEVVLKEAMKEYEFAFIQNDRDHYSFNYPSNDLLMRRIHVEPEWSGAELLSFMEGGMPKDIPYQDGADKGWIASWGKVEAGNELVLSSEKPSTSASALLDGTKLWEKYQVTAEVNWTRDYALLLVSAVDSHTYRSCAYEDGRVRLQQTSGGTTTVLAEAQDAAITAGSRTLGARVTSSSVTCLYDGRSVLQATGLASRAGGIGFQTWSPTPGAARLTISSLTVDSL